MVTSSTEAECAALTVIAKESTGERRVSSEIMELSTLPPTPIPGDNTASISLLNLGVTKRSRHFAFEWFKVKDLLEEGELKVS